MRLRCRGEGDQIQGISIKDVDLVGALCCDKSIVAERAETDGDRKIAIIQINSRRQVLEVFLQVDLRCDGAHGAFESQTQAVELQPPPGIVLLRRNPGAQAIGRDRDAMLVIRHAPAAGFGVRARIESNIVPACDREALGIDFGNFAVINR